MPAVEQLRLPGLHVRQPRPRPRLRAARDWNAEQFARVLARNGLKAAPAGTYFEDAAGKRYEAVLCINPPRVDRRATIARIRGLKRDTDATP